MTHEPLGTDVLADLVTVIPAGGVGSRLWPLSQPTRPKFLLDLLGTGSSLLQDTVARVAPFSGDIMIVTGDRHADAVRGQLPDLTSAQLVTEPSPRDSMAAIALAAAIIEHRHGTRIMASFPADHVIRDTELFEGAVRTAVAAARTGKVVTIGIEPTEPSVAFGYVKQGGELDGAAGALMVEAFTEKPDTETATRMLEEGSYVWNAGMYVMDTSVLLGHLERLQPALHAGVREIAAVWDEPARAEVMHRVWPTLTRIAIDHAISEPVAAQGGVAVVPGTFEWHDVGDFDSLAELLTPGSDGVKQVGREQSVATIEANGAVVLGGDKRVVIIGFDDAVVVDSPEALLVLRRDAAQQVKNVPHP